MRLLDLTGASDPVHSRQPHIAQTTHEGIDADITAAMDFIEFNGLPYPAMPIEARVAFILAKYVILGVVPLVIPR